MISLLKVKKPAHIHTVGPFWGALYGAVHICHVPHLFVRLVKALQDRSEVLEAFSFVVKAAQLKRHVYKVGTIRWNHNGEVLFIVAGANHGIPCYEWQIFGTVVIQRCCKMKEKKRFNYNFLTFWDTEDKRGETLEQLCILVHVMKLCIQPLKWKLRNKMLSFLRVTQGLPLHVIWPTRACKDTWNYNISEETLANVWKRFLNKKVANFWQNLWLL